ncbi:MAG: hypothetical protein ACI4X9_04580, partial [Kiritimatiellia bacterium]
MRRYMNKVLAVAFGLLALVDMTKAGVRHAGLIQGRFACEANKEPAYVFDLLETISSDLLDYTASTDMANFRAASNGGALTNPLSGLSWSWNDKTTYGYQGRLWMEGGVTYTVYSRCDDGACVFFDGTKVASPGTTSGYNSAKCATYTPSASGWVDFYAYTWDWAGGKGPLADNLWGLAFNTNGVTNTDKLTKETEPWMVFQDTGNCETLYYELPQSWLTVASYGENESGYSVTLSVTLPDDATDCEALLLYDEKDCGDHRVSDWANSVAKAISGGSQVVTIEIPALDFSNPPAVRAVVKGKEANGVDFIEYSVPFTLENNPAAELAVSAVSYADVTFSASLTALGGGATSASLELTLWGDAELTQALRTVVAAEGLDSAQTVSCKLEGLETNTTYWATVKASNNLGHEATSSAISFTTLTPEPGSFLYCNLLRRGFKDMDCQMQFVDYGAGSSSAEISFEVSKTSDFSEVTTVPVASVSGDLPQVLLGAVEELEPGTDYWARAKAVNTWGLVSYSDTFTFTTRPQPYVASGISSVVAEGGANISITLSDILDGVTGAVTLKVDGTTVQSWPIVAENGTFTCPAFVAIETGKQKQVAYSVDCEYDGKSYPATVEVEITGGMSVYIAASLSDCTNFFPRVGESITLPEVPNAFGSYFVVNETVAELLADGRTMRVLKPGGSAIVYHELDPVGATNKVVSSTPLVIPPIPAGEGKVFLWTEKNYMWRDPSNWVCLNDASLTGVDYPHNIDDVALLFQRNGKMNSNSFSFGSDASAPDITLGEIYKGSLNSYLVDEGTIELARNDKGPLTNVLHFAKSDGTVPRITFCSSQIKDRTVWFTIGRGTSSSWLEERLLCDLSQGLLIDGGYGNPASNTVRRVLLKFGNADIILPEGKEIRITNMNDVSTSINGSTVTFTAGCTFSGGGRIVHDTPTYASLSVDMSNFSGTYVESTCHPKNGFDRVYGTFLWSTNIANATLEVAGWLDTVNFGSYSESANKFRGFAGRGNTHGYGSTKTNPGNVLGYANVVLKGGLLSLKAENNQAWTDRLIVNRPAELTVARGVSAIYFYEQSNVNNPTNALTVPKLTQQNGAVLYLNEANSSANGKTPEEVRQHIRFDNFAELAIGEAGDPAATESGEVFPIIPWLLTCGNWCNNLSVYDKSGQTTYFVAVNDQNEIISPYRTVTALADASNPGQNVSCWGKAITLTEDKTINSLYKGASGSGFYDMGEGRTLTVTSGGVILSRFGSIGTEASCGTSSGRLNFPNRAY